MACWGPTATARHRSKFVVLLHLTLHLTWELIHRDRGSIRTIEHSRGIVGTDGKNFAGRLLAVASNAGRQIMPRQLHRLPDDWGRR